MSTVDYVHAGYYERVPSDDMVVLNNVSGKMSDDHIDNMVSCIAEQDPPQDTVGYYFITKGDTNTTFRYNHYYVTK